MCGQDPGLQTRLCLVCWWGLGRRICAQNRRSWRVMRWRGGGAVRDGFLKEAASLWVEGPRSSLWTQKGQTVKGPDCRAESSPHVDRSHK